MATPPEASTPLGVDFLSVLSSRIDTTTAELKDLRERCNQLDVRIKGGVARIGTRPRESMEDLIQEMERLERVHSTTPQSSADERKFMQDKERCRQKKKALGEYQVAQVELDGLKATRTEIQQQMRDKNKMLDELYAGSRKLKAASRSGVKLADVLEDTVTVPDDKIAHVIGRGGSSLRQLETDFGVNIDTDRSGGTMRVTGSAESVQLAIAAISTIAKTGTDEIALTADKVVCLTMNSAALLHEIQTAHAVRLDVSRVKLNCKITGQVEAVKAASAAIAAIPSALSKLPIQPQYMPFIIGKSGATIRQIADDCQVQIDVSKDPPHVVEVLGLRDNVKRAMDALAGLIDTNKEVEEILEMDKNLLMGAIVGPGGATIRALQKDLGAHLQWDKEGDAAKETGGAASSSSAAGSQQLEKLRIRGTTARVLNAKTEILALLKAYQSHTELVNLPEEAMPAIVGKQGANVKKLREDHPLCKIDIDGTRVKIHSTDVAARAAVRAELDRVVQANQTQSVACDSDTLILIKSVKAAELRTRLMDALGLSLDLGAEAGSSAIRLRGSASAIQEGVAALEAFKAANRCEIMQMPEDDCNALVQGGADNSLKTTIEKRFGVEVYVSRKDGTVRIRGSASDVDGARAAIVGTLSGDANHDSVILHLSPALFPSVIGKGGANFKKWETEFPGVRFDCLKDRGVVRMLGPKENVLGARLALLNHLENMTATIPVECGVDISSSMPPALEAAIAQVTALYYVQVVRGENKNILLVRGGLALVDEAKIVLLEAIEGKATRRIALAPNHTAYIKPQAAVVFRSVQDRYDVSVTLDEAANQVVITGPPEAATEAKLKLVTTFDVMFPCELLSITMLAACLRRLASPRAMMEMERGGARIYADRAFSCLRVVGEAAAVNATSAAIRQRVGDWGASRVDIPVDSTTAAALLHQAAQGAGGGGRGGSAGSAPSAAARGMSTPLAALEERLGLPVSLDLNVPACTLELRATNSAESVAAVPAVKALLAKIAKGYWETIAKPEVLGSLIGKKGANMKKLREDTGARVDVDPVTNKVRVTGSEEQVAAARAAIEAALAAESAQVITRITIVAAAFPLLIGPKGATAKLIQETGVRFDLDRGNLVAALRGTTEACAAAVALIDSLLADADLPASETAPPERVQGPAAVQTTEDRDADADPEAEQLAPPSSATLASVAPDAGYSKLPPGASPAIAEQLLLNSLSKSAQRRRRRKQSSLSSDCDAEEDEQEESAIHSSAAAATAPTSTAASASASAPAPASAPISIPGPAPGLAPLRVDADPTSGSGFRAAGMGGDAAAPPSPSRPVGVIGSRSPRSLPAPGADGNSNSVGSGSTNGGGSAVAQLKAMLLSPASPTPAPAPAPAPAAAAPVVPPAAAAAPAAPKSGYFASKSGFSVRL